MSVWLPLEADEPIGVVALSGPVDPEKLSVGLDVLRSWGHPVEVAGNVENRRAYLAGSDRARLDGLIGLLDRGIRFFVAARGGYGSTRLLRDIPWRRLAEERVRFVGFSDLTAILNPLARSVVQIHGPMVAAGLHRGANARRLAALLAGELVGRPLFELEPNTVLRGGRARGTAVGGNLSMVSALMGTPWEPDFGGRVLFLEEVAEPPYRLDRLLTHIRDSVNFRQVKALITGSLYGCRPHAESLSRWREMVLDATLDDVPVVVGLPFGHGAKNMAFPIGATVEVDTDQAAVIWSD